MDPKRDDATLLLDLLLPLVPRWVAGFVAETTGTAAAKSSTANGSKVDVEEAVTI